MNSTSASQSTSANSSSRLLLPKPAAGVQESIADIALSQLDAKLLKGQLFTTTC